MPLDNLLILPCGAIIKKRLVKSAMSDSLGNGKGNPSHEQIRLYERWAQGGIGLSIIGEVQIASNHPEKPGNLVLGNQSDNEALEALTQRASINGAHIWPQLGHAGALSHLPISQPKGPSALHIDDFHCDAMTIEEIENLPFIYAKAAKLAQNTGFTGVQIHAGHGFLLSQFLSPLFNRRQDEYGGSTKNRFRLIHAIILEVRKVVGPTFPIGIKLNASDLLEGGLTQEQASQNIKMLDSTSIDLIEISGGTYFPGAKSSSDSATKGVYYANFAAKAKCLTDIPILLTGGIKHLEEAKEMLTNRSADLIGVARAMVLNPNLANDWLSGIHPNPHFPRFENPPSEGITAWYTMRINAIALDQDDDFSLPLNKAVKLYLDRDAQRSRIWNICFNS